MAINELLFYPNCTQDFVCVCFVAIVGSGGDGWWGFVRELCPLFYVFCVGNLNCLKLSYLVS